MMKTTRWAVEISLPCCFSSLRVVVSRACLQDCRCTIVVKDKLVFCCSNMEISLGEEVICVIGIMILWARVSRCMNENRPRPLAGPAFLHDTCNERLPVQRLTEHKVSTRHSSTTASTICGSRNDTIPRRYSCTGLEASMSSLDSPLFLSTDSKREFTLEHHSQVNDEHPDLSATKD
jgi:hypothetical protein